MSYLSGENDTSIMKNAGRFVVVLIVVFAVRFGIDQYRTRTVNFDSVVEKLQTTQPEMAKMFATMQQKFPAEYADFNKSVTAAARKGGNSDEARAAGLNAMRQFMKGHIQDLAQAPSANLVAFNRQQIAVAKAFSAVDPTLCAHFVMTGLQPGDRPSESLVKELGKAGVVQMDGIAAGRQSPAGRKVDVISDADAGAMVAALRTAGLNDADLKIFGSPTGLATAPLGTQCRLGIRLLEGVSTMPADQAARITGYLITHA